MTVPEESDHEVMDSVRCPAARKYGSPPLATSKPSEQRPPLPVMASPPATNGLYSPAVRLGPALAPSDSTTSVSFAQVAPETVRSAVTTTLSAVGSVTQEVPGRAASRRRAVRARFRSASGFSTIPAVAPAFSTLRAAVSSRTLTTRFLCRAS